MSKIREIGEKVDPKIQWEILAVEHEKVFGKRPRANMKLATLEKKVAEGAKTQEDDNNTLLAKRVQDVYDAAKETATDGVPVMITLVASKRGVHMSMAGDIQNVSVMIATAMANQPAIAAVISNAAMMHQMHTDNQSGEAPLKVEKAPADTPKPQTEA